ncbi:ligand-dependent corepressor isoform X2 [Salminus brasiliensis]|uniref:ligand-dependent corepressor isoform X2 n=1 Tax=Salminus brasiliensis TaxID=930266 RepID=UPI003B83427F
MASLCKRQQCTIERRGFRQELDSWRHKLIHCVGFESILEGLFGPGLVKRFTVFQDCAPKCVSDWSFDENCLFCCLRKEKENLSGLNHILSEADRHKSDQSSIIRLEKQAEDFLNAVFSRRDRSRLSDSRIPLVAHEIMQRMIRQFAVEYTSKTSATQDISQPQSKLNCTKDQSLQKVSSLELSVTTPTSLSTGLGINIAASAQNPVLSKLLMADQDSPLDLTVKKPDMNSCNQDGVLDLSTRKNKNRSSICLRTSHAFSIMPVVRGHSLKDDTDEGGRAQKSLKDGIWENRPGSASIKPPLARSLFIKEEFLNQKHRSLGQQSPLSLANLETVGLLNHSQTQHLLFRDGSWVKPQLDSLLKLKQAGNNLADLKDLPLFLENNGVVTKGTHASHDKTLDTSIITVKNEAGNSAPVDLKIPQVKGMDLSWDCHGNTSDLYNYNSMAVSSVHAENCLSKKLRAILPKQSRRAGLGGLLDGSVMGEYWSTDADQSTSGPQYATSDPEADPTGSKQPRKKRGRYRQYNSEILEEAIAVVMSGKMSVSKAQNIYGIPHSTLEYKVKERMGTLKNPPKKKLKLMMRMEGQDSGITAETEITSKPTTTSSAVEKDVLQEVGETKDV